MCLRDARSHGPHADRPEEVSDTNGVGVERAYWIFAVEICLHDCFMNECMFISFSAPRCLFLEYEEGL